MSLFKPSKSYLVLSLNPGLAHYGAISYASIMNINGGQKVKEEVQAGEQK